MPIYEYDCPRCGVVEVMQKISDDPLKRCPNCRCKVKRLISLNNFHLKGSGWYATDYARKNGGNGAADKNSESEASTSAESSSDKAAKDTSKPAEKKSAGEKSSD